MSDNNAHEKALTDAVILHFAEYGVDDVKDIFDKVDDADKVGVFCGVTFSKVELPTNAIKMNAGGFWNSVFLISCRTHSQDDPQSDQLHALVKQVRDAWHVEDLADEIDKHLTDQTIVSVMVADPVPANSGNIRKLDLFYNIIHSVYKED